MLHFVGFKKFDQRYWNARRTFGPPHFLHHRWDKRAFREIMDGDTIVFAKGNADQSVSDHNGDDEYYET